MEKENRINPSYYNKNGMQLIDVWKAKFSEEGFKGMCKLSISKYIYRADHKNGLEDYEKAMVYLNWLIEYIEEKHPELIKDETAVKHPNHYEQGGLQILDVWRTMYTFEEFKTFCVTNVDKYVMRAEKRNGLEDYKKARVYLGWIIEGLKGKEKKVTEKKAVKKESK